MWPVGYIITLIVPYEKAFRPSYVYIYHAPLNALIVKIVTIVTNPINVFHKRNLFTSLISGARKIVFVFKFSIRRHLDTDYTIPLKFSKFKQNKEKSYVCKHIDRGTIKNGSLWYLEPFFFLKKWQNVWLEGTVFRLT